MIRSAREDVVGIWVRVGEIWFWVRGVCGGVGGAVVGLVWLEGWAGLGIGFVDGGVLVCGWR